MPGYGSDAFRYAQAVQAGANAGATLGLWGGSPPVTGGAPAGSALGMLGAPPGIGGGAPSPSSSANSSAQGAPANAQSGDVRAAQSAIGGTGATVNFGGFGSIFGWLILAAILFGLFVILR